MNNQIIDNAMTIKLGPELPPCPHLCRASAAHPTAAIA